MNILGMCMRACVHAWVCVCVQACITIRHCANDLVILNKVVFHIVSETVKTVRKKFVFYNLRGCI